MAALINNDLANAMDTLERRILSLNYNGYFTRNLFSELKDVLGLWVAFRIHSNEKDEKFHPYGQHDEYVEKFLNLVGSSLAGEEDEEKKKLRVLLNTLKGGKPSCDVRTEKIEEPITVKDFGPAQVRDHNRDMLPVQTKIDIPLWVKHCSTCNAFLEYNETSCPNPNCDNSSLSLKLRGIIRLYSCLGQEDLSQLVNGLGDGQGAFGQRICRLFALQEQPDCFTTYTENKTDCEKCRYKDHCSLVKAKGKNKKSPIDPDEVLHQLQEKCREILGLDYKLPILVYDAKKRNLKYRAIDYLTPPPSENLFRIINTIKNATRIKNKITEAAKQVSQVSQVSQVIEQGVYIIFASSDKEKITDAVHQIFKTIIQRIDTGVTKYVWHTWENLEILSDGGLLADVSKDKIEFDIDLFDKKLEDFGDDSNEILRVFAEALWFTGLQDAIVVTPLGYMGQKLGLIFTMIRKRPGEKSNNFSQRLRDVQDTFSRIAREFAALLFHSLEYEMYQKALNKLKDSSIDQVPNILLDVFPIGFNLVAGAFWSKAQIGTEDVPCFLHAFRESDSKNPPKIPGPEGLNLCPFMDLKDEKEDFFEDELAQNSDRISDCWKTKKTIVDQFTSKTGAKVYGDGDEKNKKKLDIRSRLLVPVGKDDPTLPNQLRGVFGLYFDQSHYVLHRHALDLAREIRFVFTQTAYAAKQKQGIINRGRRAAVSAIMARNMSHNIGSHVLSYWVTTLNKMNNIEQSENARLYGYLRERMDFIAEICTMDPTWSTNMRFCEDILIPFLSQRILLNNIARSEKACRDIEGDDLGAMHPMHFKVTIDDSFALTASWRSKGRTSGFFYSFKETPKPTDLISKEDIYKDKEIVKNDVTVAIPHGFIGIHAFYSIVENFIRNSAKHGGTKLSPGDPLEIHFKADTKCNPEFVKLVISDNAGSCDYELLQQLSKALNPAQEPLTDYKGKLKSGNWGIKEMRISANYLRMRGSERVDEIETGSLRMYNKQNQDRLIGMACDFSCTQGNLKCSSPNVRYSFLFMKPRDALIVHRENFAITPDKITILRSQGLFFATEENFRNMIAKSIVIPHCFLLYISSTDMSSFIIKHKEYLPFRIIDKNEINDDDFSAGKLYLNWLKSNYRFHQEITIRSQLPYNISLISNADTYQGIDPKTTILLDDHGECFENSKDLASLAYYQPYRKDERVVRLLRDIGSVNAEIQNIKRYEMIEAFLTQIIIADERIWAKMNGTWTFPSCGHVDRKEVLERMKIHLVPVDGKKAKVSDIQAAFEGLDDNTPVFFIIHQGLIDKMDDTGKEEMEKVVKTNSNKKKLYYIITSGRGKPRPLAPGARFIEISQLESLVEERDKYGLVQILFSLRRPYND